MKGSGVLIGGMVGYAFFVTANNIDVRNLSVDGGNNIGGVFGIAQESAVNDVVIENVNIWLNCVEFEDDFKDLFCRSEIDEENFDGVNNFGLFAGSLSDSVISNVFVSNSEINIIATELENVGGFAGDSANSEYSQIAVQDVTINIASGEVDYVGGLVGRAQDDEYSDVYANVEFAIDSIEWELFAIGGLFGRVQSVDLSNAYSVASGVIDLFEGFQVFEDQVSLFGGGPLDSINPIVGLITSSLSANEVYYDNDVWNEDYIDQYSIGTPKTTSEMKSISTYSDESWDFQEVWALNSQVNEGYPCLLEVTDGCEPEELVDDGGDDDVPSQTTGSSGSSSGSSPAAVSSEEVAVEADGSKTYAEEVAQVLARGIVTQEPEAITNKCEALVMMSRAFEWNVPVATTGTRYNDVPEWCESVAVFGTDRGVVEGRTPTSLGMETPVTRHEVAVMLFRELNLQGYQFTGTEVRQFSDEIVEWAREAVMNLVREGIIKGFDNGTFGGTQGILKQDLGVMLLRIVTN